MRMVTVRAVVGVQRRQSFCGCDQFHSLHGAPESGESLVMLDRPSVAQRGVQTLGCDEEFNVRVEPRFLKAGAARVSGCSGDYLGQVVWHRKVF